MTTGGMRRMGAGRKALVMAVSLTALLAAITEAPTSSPVSSSTTTPSLSSLFLISTAFRVLAVAVTHTQSECQREGRNPPTHGGERDESLDHHLGLRAPGPRPLEQAIESHCNGTSSCHCSHIPLHKPPSRHRLHVTNDITSIE